jgi:hypothetical protein
MGWHFSLMDGTEDIVAKPFQLDDKFDADNSDRRNDFLQSGVLSVIPKRETQLIIVTMNYKMGSEERKQYLAVVGGIPKDSELRDDLPTSSLERMGISFESRCGSRLRAMPVDDGVDEIAAELDRLSENDDRSWPNLRERISDAVDTVEERWRNMGKDLLDRWIY